jgi:hypothetical protein
MFSGAFGHLRPMALNPYDLALSKLERNIERDRSDVRHLARTIPFDLELLQIRHQTELRHYLGNPVREDLAMLFRIEMINEDRSSQ